MRSMKNFYIVMCVFGLILPWYQLIMWISEKGLNFYSFVDEIFLNRITLAGWTDLMLTAIIIIAFILYDRIRSGVKYFYIPIFCTFFIGASFGLPLYLYMRERRLNE